MILKRIIAKMRDLYVRRSSESYIRHLRRKGVAIGDGTYIRPKHCKIDLTRPSLISIGKNCYINEYFTMLTHDWVTNVFINSGRQFLNSSGKVTIGDNVSFGRNVMILKGVKIGNNCFIGAGSIVNKDIPSNSIAVGVPCKVICGLEDYYKKRLIKCEYEAYEYARSIEERFHRKPVAADFWEEFPFFVSGDKIDNYPEIPIRSQLGGAFLEYSRSHQAKYKDLNSFLKAAGCKL